MADLGAFFGRMKANLTLLQVDGSPWTFFLTRSVLILIEMVEVNEKAHHVFFPGGCLVRYDIRPESQVKVRCKHPQLLMFATKNLDI